jgi:hypothetical protein
MDDLLVILFWVVIVAGAGIFKLLGKLLSAGSGAKTLTEAGKRAKPLIDALSSGDWDKFSDQMKRMSGEEEEQAPPGRQTGTAVRQQRPESRAETPPLSLEERLRRYAEERQRAMGGQREEPKPARPQPMEPPRPERMEPVGPEPVFRRPEPDYRPPEPRHVEPPRPRVRGTVVPAQAIQAAAQQERDQYKSLVATGEEHARERKRKRRRVEAQQKRPEATGVLARFGAGDRRTLRDAFVLREIFGPARSRQGPMITPGSYGRR